MNTASTVDNILESLEPVVPLIPAIYLANKDKIITVFI